MTEFSIFPTDVHGAIRGTVGGANFVGGTAGVDFGSWSFDAEVHLPSIGEGPGVTREGAPGEDDRVGTFEIDGVRPCVRVFEATVSKARGHVIELAVELLEAIGHSATGA